MFAASPLRATPRNVVAKLRRRTLWRSSGCQLSRKRCDLLGGRVVLERQRQRKPRDDISSAWVVLQCDGNGPVAQGPTNLHGRARCTGLADCRCGQKDHGKGRGRNLPAGRTARGILLVERRRKRLALPRGCSHDAGKCEWGQKGGARRCTKQQGGQPANILFAIIKWPAYAVWMNRWLEIPKKPPVRFSSPNQDCVKWARFLVRRSGRCGDDATTTIDTHGLKPIAVAATSLRDALVTTAPAS